MDKYEYKLKLDQMKSLAAEHSYGKAAEIADTINWNKIRNVNALVKAGEIYEHADRLEDSREVLLMAYSRSPIGRMIVYRLAKVAVKMGNFDEAEEYYKDFVEIAPHDNLKYVLRYKISKAQGADNDTLIRILEELKDQEYTEEWAYELACLYHKAGQADKCVEACDELVLWFGDGPYVERALELKMLYQPLSKQQEEKYRLSAHKRDGVVEVRPGEALESGEIVNEPVQIPDVKLSPDRFNTQNLQRELQESMMQIMEATEPEMVESSLQQLKKLTGEIPYLQVQEEEINRRLAEAHIQTPEEIDHSLKENFQEILAEEHDGQIRIHMPERTSMEHQITGQMNIEDVMSEWDKTRYAAEAALHEADQRKLESARARALVEADEMMGRLNDMIPKMESGWMEQETEPSQQPQQLATEVQAEELQPQQVAPEQPQQLATELQAPEPQQLALEPQASEPQAEHFVQEQPQTQPYEQSEPEEYRAGWIFEDINRMIQEELDQIDAQTAAREAEQQRQQQLALEAQAKEAEEKRQAQEAQQLAEQQAKEAEEKRQAQEAQQLAEQQAKEAEEKRLAQEAEQQAAEAERLAQEAEAQRLAEQQAKESQAAEAEQQPPQQQLALEPQVPEPQQPALDAQAEEPIADEIARIMAERVAALPDGPEELPKIQEPEEDSMFPVIKEFSPELREIFTYFVSIKGMEQQICQALTGAAGRLLSGKSASFGNVVIQGGSGSGKTVLATGLVKALQKEAGVLSGKVGKIEAEMLNGKNIAGLLEKVAGGCLIIEKAGKISGRTAAELAELLKYDTSGTLVIIEDTRRGIEAALGKDAGFAAGFSEKIVIPIFTSDELVIFARAYANELGYTIDEVGTLALYNCISNIQNYDRPTTLTEIKDIVDGAIAKSEKGGLKKAFSIITSRRYNEEDYVILREKDFGI